MQNRNTRLHIAFLEEQEISITIKREDLLHPFISGNKFRKLKYNILEAQKREFKTLLTFGGAYSNHIAATAYAGKKYGFKTIGVIRGKELENNWQDNPTLELAHKHGMAFSFVTREAYRNKGNSLFISDLEREFGQFYLVPEGGTNELAIKGCQEILTKEDNEFNYICCAVGTGGTISGLANSAKKLQKVLGFPALKGDFLNEDIRTFTDQKNWELITNYHFGGYGKISEELIRFINEFNHQHAILLDPIYTAKMMFGILDMAKKDISPKEALFWLYIQEVSKV